MEHEISSARLQSRITWAKLGDANTKFFHAVASARKNQNAIWSLQDVDGVWISDDKGLKDLGVRHFKDIFSDDGMTNLSAQLKVLRLFPSYLTEEDREAFTSPVTLSEVEDALKTFKKDKAPGPDGWTVEFYLCFFDLLGPSLLNLVETSRSMGMVSPALNSTFIALIPKNEHPIRFGIIGLSLCAIFAIN